MIAGKLRWRWPPPCRVPAAMANSAAAAATTYTITNLGSLGGGSGNGLAVNNNGVMVGGEDVYSGGTAQNLNNLPAAGSSDVVTNVTAINDNGQIVATDIPRVFLLTPN